MTLSARFEEALVYAHQLHAGQRRKSGGAPYVAHLLAVTAIVLEHGGDEDEAIAALLHDAVEDQGGAATRASIQQRFGERVAAIVDGCSDTDVTPKPPWRERKLAYLTHLPQASPSVRLVSAADKLHNARALVASYRREGEALWRHFRGGREGTLWHHRALVTALQQAGSSSLVEELDRVVCELEALANGATSASASLECGASRDDA